MHILCDAFIIPKSGNYEDEIEDAYFVPGECPDISGSILNFALSDGASEGAFSNWFSDSLVHAFSKMTEPNLEAVIENAIQLWQSKKTQYVDERQKKNTPLLWYEEASIIKGAFATFLGVRFTTTELPGEGQWYATSVGDTCLFQIRDDELISQFPLIVSTDFNNHPNLISTNYHLNEAINLGNKESLGFWKFNDTFYMMTDAMSQWFLSQAESDRKPWRVLDFEYIRFGDFIENLRDERHIRNDDTTMIKISILPEG
jgi:hypothetical protein